MREVKVVLLPGDGIGPEVIGEARRLVDHVAPMDDMQVDWDSHAVGGCAIDTYGKPLPDGVRIPVHLDAVHVGHVIDQAARLADHLGPDAVTRQQYDLDLAHWRFLAGGGCSA